MIRVEKISADDWIKNKWSEKAHEIAFNEFRPSSVERISFALLACDGDAHLMYISCRENDSETLYWQFGGAFPGTKQTSLSWQSYNALLDWCKERYKRVIFLTLNTNVSMLKFGLKSGFKIVGLRCWNGEILLEHAQEFS